MNPPFLINPRFLLFSAFISTLACAVAFLAQLSDASLFAAVTLLFLHLPAYRITRRKSPMVAKPSQWTNLTDGQALGFILAATVLGTGLGFLSWLLYLEPGSPVPDILIQVSPLLGWAVVMAGYFLITGSRALTADRESKHGYLLGAVVFSTAGFLFFFWLSAQVFSFTIDDAYITFRYSRNLAAGWGPTYNPGQPPVEGYTTFAWMLLMTIPHFIGINVATFSKVAGVLLTSGTLALAWFLTYVLARNQATLARLFFGAFAAYLTGMLPITAIHAISGMETSLFTFLITFMASVVLVGVREGSQLLIWIPFIGLWVGLTRPEGNVISAGLIIFAWFLGRGSQRNRLAWASLWMYLLPGALYFLWRFHYYQLAFPLPFYIKVLHAGWLAGASEVGSYLHYLLPTTSVLAVVALLRYRREFAIILLPIAFLLVFYLFPSHVRGFEWRFIYPATPFLYVITALGIWVLFDLLSGQIANKPHWEMLFISGLFVISLGNLNGSEKLISGKINYGTGIDNYKTLGILLGEYDHEHQYTLALGDAGTAPYYSDWQVIDLLGLNSYEVAFGTQSIPDLLFNRKPVDLIVLSVGANRNRISEAYAGANALYKTAVPQGMTRIATIPFGRTQFIWVVGYPDSDLAHYIQKNLSINVE